MRISVFCVFVYLSGTMLIHAAPFFQDVFSNGDNWSLGHSNVNSIWGVPVEDELRANYYGRDGIASTIDVLADGSTNITNICFPSTASNYVAQNTLRMEGLIPDATVPANQLGKWAGDWKGLAARFTNRTFSASRREPFGVEFFKVYSRLDCRAQWKTGGSTSRMNNEFFMLLYRPNGFLAKNALDSYPDKVLFYEQVRATINNFRSYWGHYIFGEVKYDLTNAVSPLGLSVKLTNAAGLTGGEGAMTNVAGNMFEWQYHDGLPNDFGGVTPGGANTNTVGIRITHDGEYVRFYMNPNPLDNAAFPMCSNEYYHVATVPISWSNDFTFMFGRDTSRYDSDTNGMTIWLSNLIVRPVCSNLVAEMWPVEFQQGSTSNLVEFALAPTFYNANDAGISEIIIMPPAQLTNVVWSNALTFFRTVNGATTNTFSVTNAGGPAKGRVMVFEKWKDGAKQVVVRLCRGSASSNDVVSAANTVIHCGFTINIPGGSFGKNIAFTVRAGNEAYQGDGIDVPHATTESVFAGGGNVLAGLNGTAGSLTFSVYNSVTGLASVTPGSVDVSTPRTEFNFGISLSEATNANPDVSQAMILYPAGFNPPAILSQIKSIYITNIGLTNYSGSNGILFDYAASSVSIPAPGGFDLITLPLDNTPVAGTNRFIVMVRSKLSGQWVEAGTNALYNNQTIVVRPLPPTFSAKILQPYVFNSTNLASNMIDYRIVNTAGTGNDIRAVKLAFPLFVTGILSAAAQTRLSSNVISVENGSNVVTFWFTNTLLHASSNEIFRIWFTQNVYSTNAVPETNGDIVSSCDNGNGSGYVSSSSFDDGWTLSIVNQQPLSRASVTSSMFEVIDRVHTNSILVTNYGSPDNVINVLRIAMPAGLLPPHQYASLTTSSNESFSFSNIGGTNYLYVNYLAAGTNIRGISGDRIDLVYTNTYTNTEATLSFTLAVANSTNYYPVETLETDTNSLTVGIRFPTPAVDLTVTSGTIIDSSMTVTNIALLLTNSGRSGNSVNRVRIFVDTNFVLGISNITGTHAAVSRSYSNAGYIDISYVPPLLSGETDAVSFSLAPATGVSGSDMNFTNEATSIFSTANVSYTTGSAVNRVQFIYPEPAGLYSLYPRYLSTNTGAKTIGLSITNNGTTVLDRIKIILPDILTNVIAVVPGSIGGGFASNTAINTLNVFYTNGGIPPGSNDTVRITFSNASYSFTNLPVSNVFVYNRRDTEANGKPAAVNTLFSNLISFAPAWTASIDPATTNLIAGIKTYRYTFTYTGGGAVSRFRFALPTPPLTGIASIIGNAHAAIVNGTNMIEYAQGSIAYSVTVEFSATNIMTNDMSGVFPGEVDYGDGGGYTALQVSPSLAFTFPPAEARVTYMTPNAITRDTAGITFALTVSNTSAIAGNDIRFLAVRGLSNGGPSVITGYDVVGSDAAISNWTNTNGMLWIGFAPPYLRPGDEKTIQFRAVFTNNLTAPSNLTWGVSVGNKLTSSGMDAAVIDATNSVVAVLSPTYGAAVSLSAATTTNIASSVYQLLRSEYATNLITLYISNTSAGYPGYRGLTNIITGFRIAYPDKVTNITLAAPALGTPVNTNGASTVTLAAPLFPGEYTVAQLVLVDTNRFESYGTNFDVLVYCNTSGTNGVRYTADRYWYYYEPLAAHANLATTTLFKDTNNTVEFEIFNDAAPGNNINKAMIVMPTNGYVLSYLTNAALSSSLIVNTNNIHVFSNVIYIDYFADGDRFGGGTRDTIRFSPFTAYTNQLFSGLSWGCYADNTSPAGTNMQPVYADAESALVMRSIALPAASYCYAEFATNVLYTIFSSNTALITIRNDMDDDVSAVGFRVNGSAGMLSNYRVRSKNTADAYTQAVITSNGYLMYQYPATNALQRHDSDVLSVLFDQSVSNTTNFTVDGFYIIKGTSVWLPIINRSNTLTNLAVQYANWGAINGRYLPASEPITVNCYRAGGASVANDTAGRALISASSVGDNSYSMLNMPPGTYDIELVSKNFYSYRYFRNVVVTENTITVLSNVTLYAQPLYYDRTTNQTAAKRDDASVVLAVYTNALYKSMFVDIDSALPNEITAAFPRQGSTTFYNMNMLDLDRQPITNGVALKSACQLTLRGAAGTALSLWAYEPITRSWRAIGEQSTAGSLLSAPVNYLCNYYAVYQGAAVDFKNRDIANVTVTPNPFTPSSGQNQFAFARLAFVLKEAITQSANEKIRIYDLRGRLIRELPVSTQNLSVEALWDGRDMNGYAVRSGTYVFQIKMNKSVYSGTVMVIR